MSDWEYCEYGLVHKRCRCIEGRKNAVEVRCTSPEVHSQVHDSRVEFPQASKAELEVLGTPRPEPKAPVDANASLKMALKYLNQGRTDLAKLVITAILASEETHDL